MNREQLQKLPRAELQKLAKTHGVKANLKSDVIITQLLERFSEATTSGPSQDVNNDAQVAEGSQTFIKQTNAPDVPPKRAVRMKALQKRPIPQVVVPEHSQETASAAATPKTRASSKKRGPQLSKKISAKVITAGPSARTDANRSVSSASRAPYDTTHRVASPNNQSPYGTSASAIRHPMGSNDVGEISQLQDSQAPFDSISAGGSRERRSRHEDQGMSFTDPIPAPAAVSSLGSSRHHNSPNVRPPAPPTAEQFQIPITLVDDDDSTWAHTDILPAGDVEYTGQIPTCSYASTTPTGALDAMARPALASDPEPQEPTVSTEQVKAVVAKIADIARVVRTRRRTVHGYDTRTQGLGNTVGALRSLVRQERAHRERMQNYLAYWHPVEPRWRECEIWEGEGPTRIDEHGNEVEIMSDDEEQEQEQNPMAAPSSDAESRKRRRVTPGMESTEGRPSKKLRLWEGADEGLAARALEAILEEI
ncbi:hypothetical protein C8Q78DRAFT_1157462 [Trametes maxima]|nr:hypothetical protein C8Q78DRAFT_1157462 [Trametes maxima]